MNWIKKHLLLFSLIFLVYSIYFVTHIPQKQITAPSVLGAASNLSLFVEPKDGRQFLLEALDNANTKIDVAMYLLSDKEIIHSLTKAKERGIQVRVMLEEHPFGGGNLNQKTKKILEDAHVDIKWSNHVFALTHEKSVVVDNAQAFILNQNLTASAFSKNREFDIVDNNPQDVTVVEDIFNADWERKQVLLKSSNLVVSPDTARNILTTLLQGSNKSIDMEMEIIEDKKMLSLLEQKAQTETIRIIIPDLSQIPANKEEALELAQKGVQVKTENSPYIHAKLILVDRAKAYIGSVNLSSQSLDRNRELGIILTQQDIIDSLTNDFENDWSFSENLR